MTPPATHEHKAALISIVDDETCVRDSLSSLLRSAGYQAKGYASVEDFLTWGWWEETACLILDVRLPGMGGLELQRYLAESERPRPIVFISGYATENEQIWGMMRGAVAFLRKPFGDEALLDAVRRSIARARTGPVLDSERPHHQLCPLCHESVSVAVIPRDVMLEHTDLRAATVTLIKTLNPGWDEHNGLCERCWKFYVSLGRVLNFMRTPESSLSTASGKGNSTAANEKG